MSQWKASAAALASVPVNAIDEMPAGSLVETTKEELDSGSAPNDELDEPRRALQQGVRRSKSLSNRALSLIGRGSNSGASSSTASPQRSDCMQTCGVHAVTAAILSAKDLSPPSPLSVVMSPRVATSPLGNTRVECVATGSDCVLAPDDASDHGSRIPSHVLSVNWEMLKRCRRSTSTRPRPTAS